MPWMTCKLQRLVGVGRRCSDGEGEGGRGGAVGVLGGGGCGGLQHADSKE